MKLQNIENTCSLVHLYDVQAWDLIFGSLKSKERLLLFIQETSRNNNAIEKSLCQKIVEKDDCSLIYYTQDKNNIEKLKKIGFVISGKYKGYKQGMVSIITFHYKDNKNWLTFKQKIKKLIEK